MREKSWLTSKNQRKVPRRESRSQNAEIKPEARPDLRFYFCILTSDF
jgi:hypothetical protein